MQVTFFSIIRNICPRLKNTIKFIISFVFYCLCLVFFINSNLYSKENKILVGKISAFESKSNPKIKNYIKKKIKKEFSEKNIQYSSKKHSQALKQAKDQNQKFYIEVFYKTYPDFPPDLYAQVYNPETDSMIDAVSLNTDFDLIQGIELDKKEFTSEERIDEFVKKLEVSIKVNRNREKQPYNILEHFVNKPISKHKGIRIQTIDRKEEAQKVYKLLEENRVVTASRKAQTVKESPAKVIVVDSKTIERRGYRTLTEVLQDVIGFDFNSFYDSGEFTTDLLLRGIGDVGQTQILIMEDGIIQNDIGNGWMRHVQYDITLIDVKRIEIILGPGSALYGANAYAGLINIITKKGKDILQEGKNVYWKGRVDYGSHRTKMLESMFAYQFDSGLRLRFAGRYFETPGDAGEKRHDPGNYFHNNYEPDEVQINDYGKVDGSYPSVQNDRLPGNARKPLRKGFDTSKENVFVRGAVEKGNFSLGYTLWDLTEGLGSYVPGYEYFTNTRDITYRKRHNGYYINASYTFQATRNLSSLMKLYTRNTNIHPDTGFVYTYRFQSVETPVISGTLLPPVPDKVKQYHGQSYLSGYQQQFNYNLTNTNDLVFGLQLERVKRAATGDELGGISLGKKQSTKSTIVESRWDGQDQQQSVMATFYSTNAAFYIQDEQKFWNDKYGLTVGIRRDYDTDYGYVWTARSGFVGNPFSWMYFKLLYGEAFKAPTVFQLYDEFRGNEFLKPQRIRTYETELTFLPYKSINLRFGYFFSKLTGLIAEAPNPNDGTYVIGSESQKATYYQNLAPTHIYGTSAELEWKMNQKLSFFTNYTFTRDRDPQTMFEVDSDPETGAINGISLLLDGHEIDNIAARKWNIGVNYLFFNKLNVNLRLNWVGKRKAPTTNSYFQPYDYGFTDYPYVAEGTPDGYMSAYTLVNMTLTYQDTFGINNLTTTLIVRNLTNKSYMGMGRQSGNATRPIDSYQPTIQNPSGFVAPYHPQMGREIYFRLSYQLD